MLFFVEGMRRSGKIVHETRMTGRGRFAKSEIYRVLVTQLFYVYLRRTTTNYEHADKQDDRSLQTVP